MNFISTAMAVLTAPKTGLPRAAAASPTRGSVIGGYAAIMAALPAIASLIMFLLVMLRIPGALGASPIISLVIGLVLMYIVRDLGVTIGAGYALSALAPSFGGRRDDLSGLKLAAFAATPIWLASALAIILIGLVPQLYNLYFIILIAGFAYTGYLIYLGCGPLLGVPAQQAPAVAAVITIGWLVLYFLAERVVGLIISPFGFGGPVMIGY